MTVRITTPGFAYLADVVVAFARTVEHGRQAGLDEDDVRAAIGARLCIDAEDGRATDWTLLCDHLTVLAHEKSRKDRDVTINVVPAGPGDHPPHDCPGGCGQSVPHRLLACGRCWHLLPAEQRKAITQARGAERLRLVGEAVGWYRENVRDGQLVVDETKPAPRITIADRFGGFPR
jgi:hypothetical protein